MGGKVKPIFVIKYEDTEKPDDVFIGEGAEECALKTFDWAKDK